MNDDDELLDRLGEAMTTSVPDPSPDRIAAVREAALRAQTQRFGEVAPTGVSGRRALLLSAAAAAVGATGGAVVVNAADDDPPTAAPGPPTEALQFSASTEPGSTLAGKVTNHTWGVELLLDAGGFAIGSRYRVVYIDTDATSIEAGGFVGSEIPIHCRCNAALLRNGISTIEIRDADDSVISHSDFAERADFA